jgi:long-chain acyl-CoA synthetase
MGYEMKKQYDLIGILKQRHANYENKEALQMIWDNGNVERYSYRDIFNMVDSFSSVLKSAGIENGDRIVLSGENSPHWVIAFFAIASINATSVLIDSSLPKEEIKRLIDMADSRGIIISSKVKQKLYQNEDQYPDVPVFDMKTQSVILGSVQCVNKHMIDTVDPDNEVIAIFFSSGTTSTAKGVMVRYESVLYKVQSAIDIFNFTYNDSYVHIIPIYHIYGFNVLMCSLLSGASMSFIESISRQNMNKAFQLVKPTIFFAVPKVYNMFYQNVENTVLKKGKKAKKIFHISQKILGFVRSTTKINISKSFFHKVHEAFGGRVRLFGCGGMILEKNISYAFYNMGFSLLSAYGLTETCIPAVAPNLKNIAPGTNGKPFPGVELKFGEPDQDGNAEIMIKSLGVFKEYFRDKETTKEAFTEDGWFKTGDLGKLDRRGNLIVVGRTKEAIVLSNGKKASPNDIEEMYGTIEGIDELVILGISVKSKAYDEIHAFIVKSKSNLSDNEIIENIKNLTKSFPSHLRIMKTHFIEMIPKTSMQKPKRYLLKKSILEKGL